MNANALRLFTAADYDRFVAFRNHLRPESPRSVDELRHFEAQRAADEYHGRFLLEQNGELIAATSYVRDMNFLSGNAFIFDLLLESERFGLAGALYEHLLGVLEPYNPVSLRVHVREDWQHWPAFYAELGFEEYERRWASVLNLASLEPDKFVWALAKAQGAGITFKTLADLPDDTSTQRLLYSVVVELLGDVPDEYHGRFLLDGSELVGVSVAQGERADTLHTGLTGVRRNWRRQGVAQALKLKAANMNPKNAASRPSTPKTTRPTAQCFKSTRRWGLSNNPLGCT